jgi:hypothetical protein
MNSIVKNIRNIHIQELSRIPSIYQAIITYETKDCGKDKGDWEGEQKRLVNQLINDKWFNEYDESDDLEYLKKL